MNQELYQTYLDYSDIPRWLMLLEISGKFTPQEIEELENIDDDYRLTSKELKNQYHRNKMILYNSLQEFQKEVGKERGEKWVKERKLEYLLDKKSFIDAKIIELEKYYLKSVEKDESYQKRETLFDTANYNKLIKERKRLDTQVYWLKYRGESENGKITPQDIVNAENYPIENLIEINSAGFAKCVNPNHQDNRPSMYCRNNYVYCFSCGFTANAIKLAQTIWGTSFVETVKKLIN